jgi:hypothetical protein
MIITLAGPAEGHLDRLFDAGKADEAAWIVCAGDFGVWPDPMRRDRAARQHGGNEFASRYVGSDSRLIKIPVLTVAGVHEDHRFLKERIAANNTEILSNVHYLANGYRTTIGFDGPACRVTGIGRAYSEATYRGEYHKKSHRHYTRHDVERACSSGPTDLLVIYEHLDAEGLRNVIFATRPQLILTVAHPNRPVHAEIQGIPVISLGRGATQAVSWKNSQFIC